MRRVVEEEEILAAVRAAENETARRKLNRKMREELTLRYVAEALHLAPTPEDSPIPPLVGLAEASKILGTAKSYVSRLRSQKRLVPVAQLESGPVFLRADVEKAAARIEEMREAREERREEKS